MPVPIPFDRSYARALALAPRMPIVIHLMFVEFTVTDTRCYYSWRDMMQRTAPENRILLRGAVMEKYGVN